MKMDTVLANFDRLCEMPVVWAILALMAARALLSVLFYFRCPVVRQTDSMDALRDRQALDSPYLHSPRFLTTMLLGIALAVGGLYAMQTPDVGPFAVAAIMLGVFLLIVEPSRLTVEENTRRVSAARLDGPDAYAFAHERLRSAHVERIGIEVGMAALLTAMVLAGV
jgi:hypothetical protein